MAGVRIAKANSMHVDYIVLTVRYDRSSGVLSANLKDSVNRFVQLLRRTGFSLEYFRVVEPTDAGVVNHANLLVRWDEGPAGNLPDSIVKMKGRLAFSPRLVSALWNRATLGTSSVIYSEPVELDGSDTWQGTPEGLVSYLSKYLSKSIQNSRISRSTLACLHSRTFPTSEGTPRSGA